MTTFFAASTCLAEGGESSTKFFGQTAADKTSVELRYTNGSTGTVKLKTLAGADTGDFKVSATAYRFELQHGFSSSLSAGIWTDFGTTTVSVTGQADTKNTGMGDINFFLYGNAPQGSFNLQYGGEFGFSGEKKANSTSPAKDGSRNSGGMHLTPYFGMLFPMDSLNTGFKFAYALWMERSINDQGSPATVSKETGGNKLSITPFVEYNHGAGFLGLSIDLTNTAKSDSKSGGTTTTTPAYSETTFSLYATYLPSPEFELGFAYNYTQTKDYQVSSSLQKISYTTSGFQLSAQYTF